MKLVLALTVVAACSAARLDNTYLPPSTAYSAGGNENILGAPNTPSRQYSSSRQFGAGAQYGKPQSYNSQQQYDGQYSGGYNTGASGQQIPILRYSNENQGDGTYQFDYETANGIKQQEQGYPASQDEEVVEGSYSYTGDDGHVYNVDYKADANGFQASGEHLPTPPPIPDVILKSLEINAAEEARNTQSGYSYNAPSGSNTGSRQYPSRDQGYKGQVTSTSNLTPYAAARVGQYSSSSRATVPFTSGQYNSANNQKYSGPYSTENARQYSSKSSAPYAAARVGSFPTGSGSISTGQYSASGRSGPYSASGSFSKNPGKYSAGSNNQYSTTEAEFTGYKY